MYCDVILCFLVSIRMNGVVISLHHVDHKVFDKVTNINLNFHLPLENNVIPLLGTSGGRQSTDIDFQTSNDASQVKDTSIERTWSEPIRTEHEVSTTTVSSESIEEQEKLQPSDDDYVMTLIEDIKIPSKVPKVSVPLLKLLKHSL